MTLYNREKNGVEKSSLKFNRGERRQGEKQTAIVEMHGNDQGVVVSLQFRNDSFGCEELTWDGQR
jgi:hypothetical protein